MRIWLAGLCAALAIAGARAADAPQYPLDSIDQRAQPCMACHGKQGQATRDGYYPRIAGKPAGYLLNQLHGFREGRRNFPMMTYLVELQREDYLRELATYFADQQVPYPPPESPRVSPATLERGRTLVTQGDPARHLPACRSCHGSRLLGVAPAVPGLVGVSQDYLIAQLSAWRMGKRAALAPDCMAQIVRRLSPSDATAAAAFLAMQAVPADARADSAFERPPPMKCGSIPNDGGAQSGAASPPAYTPSADGLEQGRQLVTLADCRSCHSAIGGEPFAGGRAITTPFGTFFSPNITPDTRTGIGSWTADDFWHALHDGYSRDGTRLYPVFPYPSYTGISRRDADAMFAYLKTLPPVSQPNRPHELAFPYNHRLLLAVWRLLFFRPAVYRPDPKRSAQWNRGAYLVRAVAHCGTCHDARNALGAVQSRQGGRGGQVLGWYAPSLTNPLEAGLRGWSIADIVTLLRSGQLGSGAAAPHASLMGPMAEVVYGSLQYARSEDLQAMAVYLQSLPETVPHSQGEIFSMRYTATAGMLARGRALYARHCARCHGDNGEGRPPAAPPLAGDRAVSMSSDTDPIRIVLFGGYPPGTAGNPRPFGMPPYYPSLSDEQIAEVLTYVRASWGNSAPAVLEDHVAANRGDPRW
ncbi:MAG TPA: c-type cytochrome [Steroidobacteraceae bacterium]